MVSDQSSAFEQSSGDAPTAPWGTAIGLAVAVMLTIGFLAWQISRPGTQAPDAHRQADQEAVTTHAATGTIAPKASPRLFVVASEDEAGDFAAKLDALASDRAAALEQIFVMPTDEDINGLLRLMTEINRLRNAEGLAPIRVFDVRNSANSMGGPTAAGSSEIPSGVRVGWETRMGGLAELYREQEKCVPPPGRYRQVDPSNC